ncbi:cytochrome P450 2G1-like [Anomaloglossus baeobatrachus]|uniref:cytochrome P450 2G1-like n=1 Tax=Anomaloglossus baeobatrachus TaxID=238106 RepID=UPI003F4F775D
MELSTLFLGLFILFSLLILTWRIHRRRLSLPPGPIPLPFVGNLFQGSFVLYESYLKIMELSTLFLGLFILFSLLILTWRIHRRRLSLPPGPIPLPFVGNLFQGSFVLYESYLKIMELSTLFLGLFILFSLLILTWRIHRRRLSLPPGPIPLPFVGNLFQGSFVLYESYLKYYKQYGPVFTVWFGNSPVVVLCGYEVVKDALVNHSHRFGDRGHLPISSRLSKGHGIIATNGDVWKTTRRFAVTTLRNFGMGKRSMEERVQEEAFYLLKSIDATCGEAFNPHTVLGCAVNNIINLVVFGKRWDYDDKTFLKLLNITNNLFNFVRAPLGVAYSAFERIMKHLPGRHQTIFQECEVMMSFIKEEVESHRKTLNPDSPRDLIDCFLIRANKEDEISCGEFNEDNLVVSAFELFTAGTETTMNTLQFSLLLMIQYPHIQEKVQKELDIVIGPTRMPGISHRIQMPYTNAVVHEIMRYVDIVPMALAHKVSEDTFFRGFMIPKGTTVLPILSSVLADPDCWKTPYDFNPENFLDQNGLFCTHDAWMPFSAGKRICPGEGLANMEIFLFLTALLQKFTFKPANSSDTFDLWTLRRAFRKKGLAYHLRAYPRI